MAAEQKEGLGFAKKQQFNFEDSNIANLGSDLDKKCRLAAAQGENAWQAVGKEPGLLIWRIEQFKVVKSKTPAGHFYSDDSYIVLHTQLDKVNPNKLRRDIYFWLGRTTSQDEMGTAAYKTVELDDFLGGEPVQHREVQDHESEDFVNLFPGGIRILEGGVASGFKQVKPEEYKPRLLHIKGRKIPRITQVPTEAASMNSGDVFVLDLGLRLLQWNGTRSHMKEKNRAATLCRAIDDERAGKPSVTVYNQGDKDEGEFWAALGSGPDGVNPNDDDDIAAEAAGAKKLFRLSDADGALKTSQCATVTKAELNSSDVFILDAGNEVFTWIGRDASKGEKSKALHFAQEYLKNNPDRPAWLPISRVLEGGENEVFNSHFDG
jgi:gelsolin